MSEQRTPSTRQWACMPDRTEVYQMNFVSRDAAVSALGGEAGEVVCYERGVPAKDLEGIFDVASLLSRAEDALSNENVIADFESGLFDTSDVEEAELRKHLAEAFAKWASEVKPDAWAIVERTIVEREEAEEHA